MSKELIDKISRATGRYPVSCDCPRCRRQCLTPCLGTPEDIWRLIEAGYEERLRITFWAVGMLVGAIPFPILMVQAHQTEHGCIFWKNGLCELHGQGLKPTEGCLSYHVLTEENLNSRIADVERSQRMDQHGKHFFHRPHSATHRKMKAV